MSDAHAGEVKKHLKVYVNVFLALLVLTVITVGVAMLLIDGLFGTVKKPK